MKRIAVCLLLPLASLALSLVFGAMALEFFGRAFPGATLRLFKWAGLGLEAVSGGYWPAQYETISRGLIDERLLVYMGFVIAARIAIALLLVPAYNRGSISSGPAERA